MRMQYFRKVACSSVSLADLGYLVPECGYVLSMLHLIVE